MWSSITQQTRSRPRDQYDVIFDAVNALAFPRMLRALPVNGVFVTVNPFRERISPAWLARFRRGRRLRSVVVQPNAADLDMLRCWIDAGQVRPLIDRRYPLTDATAAHRYSATGRARGKLVLIVDE